MKRNTLEDQIVKFNTEPAPTKALTKCQSGLEEWKRKRRIMLE